MANLWAGYGVEKKKLRKEWFPIIEEPLYVHGHEM
jgi:hypothetical protein